MCQIWQTLTSITTLQQLCHAFNISLSEFFAEDKEASEEDIIFLNKYHKLSIRDKTLINNILIIMLTNK